MRFFNNSFRLPYSFCVSEESEAIFNISHVRLVVKIFCNFFLNRKDKTLSVSYLLFLLFHINVWIFILYDYFPPFGIMLFKLWSNADECKTVISVQPDSSVFTWDALQTVLKVFPCMLAFCLPLLIYYKGNNLNN